MLRQTIGSSRGLLSTTSILLASNLILMLMMTFFFYDHASDSEYALARYKAHQPAQAQTHTQAGPDESEDLPVNDMAYLLRELWRPYLRGITDLEYKTPDGKLRKLPKGKQKWTEHLGKKVLILDVDTRFDKDEGGLMNKDRLRREGMRERAGGRLGHMMYAMIHGYDYRFVRAPDYKGRHNTWVKVPILKEAVKTHDIVIFLDADADFINFELPVEWLLNHWHVTQETSLVMTKDPDVPTNQDSKGLVLVNTGFIIAQKSDRTQEILTALDECPSGKRYKGCGRWAKDFPHEQRAFGEFLRYDFNETNDLISLTMREANSPWGHFVRHDWFDKTHPRRDLEENILNTMIARLHGHFHEFPYRYYRDLSKKKYPLSDINV